MKTMPRSATIMSVISYLTYPRPKFPPYGFAVLILGYIIFACCWVKIRSLRDYDRKWLNWLVLAGVILGLCLFAYGVYLLAERTEFSSDGAEKAQLAFIHAPAWSPEDTGNLQKLLTQETCSATIVSAATMSIFDSVLPASKADIKRLGETMSAEIQSFADRLAAVGKVITDGLDNIKGDLQGFKDKLSQSGTLSHDDRVLLDNAIANLEKLGGAVTDVANLTPDEPAPAPSGDQSGTAGGPTA